VLDSAYKMPARTNAMLALQPAANQGRCRSAIGTLESRTLCIPMQRRGRAQPLENCMLKHPVYRHRPRPWITNPIKGSIALPMDCDPAEIDWEPLADTSSTPDNPKARQSTAPHSETRTRTRKAPYRKTTRLKQPATGPALQHGGRS